ncbi:esterase-like activity of phytase family protein [Nocardiopsis sediminis]|uniref:Esterase-like activity of phytase family protein n=1 Tax=Nocardiopsis sediminis TaxID=1778267 RepID=A0ABV8FIX7_9ACTN
MTETTIRSRLTALGSTLVVSAALLASGLPVAGAASADISGVRLIGVHDVPRGLAVDGMTVGGLSGIDRDPRTGEYLMISDDRSTVGPARYYTADIAVGADGIESVDFVSATELTRADGGAYPPYAEALETPCTAPQPVCNRNGSVDPEELRIDPRTGSVWWTTEGAFRPPGLRLDPALRVSVDGRTVREFPLPRDWAFDPEGERGPRPNITLEAFAFIDGGARVITALEGPLIQDGTPPTPEAGALTRITEHPRWGGVAAQYAYPLSPVFTPPVGSDFSDNGVVAILPTGEDGHYLVMERGYSDGVGYNVRIYEIDTTGAQDIRGVPALDGREGSPDVEPLAKTLVADLADLGVDPLFNVEGMVWGPDLPGGERSLVLVVDDNFSAEERTQVIALGVDGAAAG